MNELLFFLVRLKVYRIMFSKKIAKNCYYCIKAPLLIFNRIFGVETFYFTCSHESFKYSYQLKDSIWHKALYISICFIIYCFCIYRGIVAVSSGHEDFYYYSKTFIRLFSGLGFASNIIFCLYNLTLRKEQLKYLTDLLQNGKYYGVSDLISYKFTRKSRKYVYALSISLTTHVIIGIMYLCITHSSIMDYFEKCLMFCSILNFNCVWDAVIIESVVYKELFNNCYKKLKVILRNHINYRNIEEDVRVNVAKIKFYTLEVQLCKLRKLHNAIYDNFNLYIKFIIPILRSNVIGYICWYVFTSYATVDLAFNNHLWKIDIEYCVGITLTHICIIYLTVAFTFVEDLKKPVRYEWDFVICINDSVP